GMFMFLLFSIGALFFRTQPVRFADHSYTTWQMLGHVFGGIFTNTDGELLSTIRAAGMDPAQIGMIFGPSALELRRIGPMDTIIWMFLALGFFHWVQYSPARFARFKEQPWLLGAVAALLGGILIPSLVSGTGQFIYFVF
ncbi:MAG TPA: hypothetical protein PLD60_17965, partial [Leptospiraceae bacterium]|nr:hypothetical protein [Leptospiraceae bacterium]